MAKKHKFFSNSASKRIGFLCRLVNFLEDVLEDAGCEDILVSLNSLGEDKVVLEPFSCSEDYRESMSVFGDEYDLRGIDINQGDVSFKVLYDEIIETYASTIHRFVKQLVYRTIEAGVEHYVGILFDGRVFVAEGEENRIILPKINECLSIHTHPSLHPMPSFEDLRHAVDLMVDRGIGCVIASRSSSLAIYRTGALTVDEYYLIKSFDTTNPYDLLINIVKNSKNIKIRYLT